MLRGLPSLPSLVRSHVKLNGLLHTDVDLQNGDGVSEMQARGCVIAASAHLGARIIAERRIASAGRLPDGAGQKPVKGQYESKTDGSEPAGLARSVERAWEHDGKRVVPLRRL